MSGAILLRAEGWNRNLSGSSFSSLFILSGILLRNPLHFRIRVMPCGSTHNGPSAFAST